MTSQNKHNLIIQMFVHYLPVVPHLSRSVKLKKTVPVSPMYKYCKYLSAVVTAAPTV